MAAVARPGGVAARVAAVGALGALALSGCASSDALQPAAVTGVADRLCAEVAREYDGEVAAAYDTTVAAVREHLADPHGVDGDPARGPVPGPFAFPADWAATSPDGAAAACYVDAVIPVSLPRGAPAADRALVVVAAGASSVLVSAGPRESFPTAPLPASSRPAGGVDGLDCPDGGSVSLSVDHDSTAAGAATPEQAAHALLDQQGFPRERFTERRGRATAAGRVLELLDGDGRLVAHVHVDAMRDDTWLASGLSSCQSVWNGPPGQEGRR